MVNVPLSDLVLDNWFHICSQERSFRLILCFSYKRQIMTNTQPANWLKSRRTAVGRIDLRAKQPDTPLADNSTLIAGVIWPIELEVWDITVNLRSRTGEERKQRTLSVQWLCLNKFSPNFTFLLTDLFAKDRNTVMLSEDCAKTFE